MSCTTALSSERDVYPCAAIQYQIIVDVTLSSRKEKQATTKGCNLSACTGVCQSLSCLSYCCLYVIFHIAKTMLMHSYSGGTLPPSFTQQIRSHHPLSLHAPRALSCRPATRLTKGRQRTSAVPKIGSKVHSPRNGLLVRSLPSSPARVPSRKRPRTSQSCLRENATSNSHSKTSYRILGALATSSSAARNAGGDLWGPNGRDPSSMVETEWACSTSVASSASSYHDGFSGVSLA